MLEGGNDVEQGEALDAGGVVEGETMRDPGTAMVTDDPGTGEAEMVEQGGDVGCHGAPGVRGVGGGGARLGGLAVAAEVRADHGEPPGELRRDPVPHRAGPRVAVPEDERRARSADPDAPGGSRAGADGPEAQPRGTRRPWRGGAGRGAGAGRPSGQAPESPARSLMKRSGLGGGEGKEGGPVRPGPQATGRLHVWETMGSHDPGFRHSRRNGERPRPRNLQCTNEWTGRL